MCKTKEIIILDSSTNTKEMRRGRGRQLEAYNATLTLCKVMYFALPIKVRKQEKFHVTLLEYQEHSSTYTAWTRLIALAKQTIIPAILDLNSTYHLILRDTMLARTAKTLCSHLANTIALALHPL